MNLSNLKPAKGSVKTNQRLGRGQGSTKGGTAGRGHKGQKSRSGYSQKFGFEGGQQPIQTRVPKFGFKNINRIEYKGINLDTIQTLAESKKLKKIDKEVLREHGLVSKHDLIKILGRGELKLKLEITANAFSKTAKEAIEAAGGKADELPGRRGKKENKPKKKKGKPPKAAVKEEVVKEDVVEKKVEGKADAKAEDTSEEVEGSVKDDVSSDAPSDAPAKEEASLEAEVKDEVKEEKNSTESTDESPKVEAVDESDMNEEAATEEGSKDEKEKTPVDKNDADKAEGESEQKEEVAEEKA